MLRFRLGGGFSYSFTIFFHAIPSRFFSTRLRCVPIPWPRSPGPGWPVRRATRRLAARLASAEQTLRDISHALAHDLRTSLRHVASYAQLPGRARHYAGQPEQVARLSHKVIDSSRRLQHLMESVSALARLQAADLQPSSTVDTVADLMRSLIRSN